MVGEKVENFRLKDQNGIFFDLYENLDKNILIIFYPKDNSRVCSEQLKNYQLQKNLFLEKNIKVVGINIEDVESHRKFCDKINISIPLLFDEKKKISHRFKALNLLGFNKRKMVLIDTNGKIVLEQDIQYLNFPLTEDILSKIGKLKILQKT